MITITTKKIAIIVSTRVYVFVYVRMFQRDVQIRFDGVRGSVPEFANVAVDPQSTMPNTDTLVCMMTDLQ